MDEYSSAEGSKGGIASRGGKGGMGPGWLLCKLLALESPQINLLLSLEMILEGWLILVKGLFETPLRDLWSSQGQALRTS